MIYTVRHETLLRYDKPVSHARFNLRLRPVPWPGQTVSQASLILRPEPARQTETAGPYLVNTTRAEFESELSEFDILSQFSVQMAPLALPGAGPPVSEVREAALETPNIKVSGPAPYLFPSRQAVADAAIGQWAAALFDPEAGIVDAAAGLSGALHSEFAYAPGSTDTSTPPGEAFARRSGVCQDFAHILIIGLRWLGIPAAYASGYLRTIPPPGQEKLVGSDGMHAWVNVWCGTDLGWVGLDPTNNCLAREDHVQIGMGRDYADLAPIDGTFIGAAPQSMKVSVDVDLSD